MDTLFYKKALKEYGARLKVLCVEDEEDIRSVMCEMLKRYFNHVDEAKDGQEALEFCSLEIYDIIISDISMPNMNGIVLSENVKKLNESQRIVIVSAHNESNYLLDLINIGVDAFVLKPIDTDRLVRALYGVSKSLYDAYMLELYTNQLIETNQELEKANKVFHNTFKMTNLSESYASQSTTNPLVEKAKMASTQSEKAPTIDLIEYHDNLLTEDIHEMKDLVDDIENYILLTLQHEVINTHYLKALSDCFRKFGSILCRYYFFTNLSSGLFDLARSIEEKEGFFIQKQDFVAPFLENLIYVLHSYVEEVWVKDSDNPNFFDASILNDIATFIAILGDEGPSNVETTEDLLEFF